MNDKNTTKINNIVRNCLDCAGVDQHKVIATNPKLCSSGFYVDICIEEYTDEELAYFVGFMAQSIGMKNIWFDCYPKSGRVHLELNFDEDFLAR